MKLCTLCIKSEFFWDTDKLVRSVKHHLFQLLVHKHSCSDLACQVEI